jgi:hypothetical protein
MPRNTQDARTILQYTRIAAEILQNWAKVKDVPFLSAVVAASLSIIPLVKVCDLLVQEQR